MCARESGNWLLKELKYSNNPLLAKWFFMQSFDRIRLRIFLNDPSFSCCKFDHRFLFRDHRRRSCRLLFMPILTHSDQNTRNESSFSQLSINITHHITSQMYVLCVHNSDDILNARKSCNALFCSLFLCVCDISFLQSIDSNEKATQKFYMEKRRWKGKKWTKEQQQIGIGSGSRFMTGINLYISTQLFL